MFYFSSSCVRNCWEGAHDLDNGGGGWSFLEIHIFVGKIGEKKMATRHGGNSAYPELKKDFHLPSEINKIGQAKTPASSPI